MFAVVVTGPPGAGKTETATLLHDGLGDAGVANALIELDHLERCYPPLPAATTMAHAAALASSFRRAGHDLLFVTATLETDAYGAALLDALGADDRLLVRLTAEPDTLERRIRAREPASWSGLDGLVAAARRLVVTMSDLSGVDLVLSTEGVAPAAVAAAVEEVVRERLAARPALPGWEPGSVAVLATGAGAPHAIPISTALRAGPRAIVLGLAHRRETLARLREDPRCAFTLLAAGDVAFTAHGHATVLDDVAEGVAAVRIDVTAIQEHGTDRFDIDAGVAWHWTDPEAERRDAAVRNALARLAG